MKISLIQSPIIWEKPDENLLYYERVISQNPVGDLIILPEMFSTGFSMSAERWAENMDGSTIQWLKRISTLTGAMIGGSFIVQDDSRYYNRFVFVHQGNIIHYYDKRHLFGMAGEDSVFTAGSKSGTFEYLGWKIRPAICYDLRFPVWTRNSDNYDVLIYTANWPSKRAIHWNALLPARAIENQCYVLAVNRIGTDGNGLEYQGDSGVYGPSGQKLVSAENKETCINFNLDRTFLSEYRKELPFLQDADEFKIDLKNGH